MINLFIFQVLQVLICMMGHSDHNVVNASLEACQQLLKHPTPVLLSILNTKGSIRKTSVYKADVLAHTAELGEYSDNLGFGIGELNHKPHNSRESEILNCFIF